MIEFLHQKDYDKSLETIENICWIWDIFTVWFVNFHFWWI